MDLVGVRRGRCLTASLRSCIMCPTAYCWYQIKVSQGVHTPTVITTHQTASPGRLIIVHPQVPRLSGTYEKSNQKKGEMLEIRRVLVLIQIKLVVGGSIRGHPLPPPTGVHGLLAVPAGQLAVPAGPLLTDQTRWSSDLEWWTNGQANCPAWNMRGLLREKCVPWGACMPGMWCKLGLMWALVVVHHISTWLDQRLQCIHHQRAIPAPHNHCMSLSPSQQRCSTLITMANLQYCCQLAGSCQAVWRNQSQPLPLCL